MPFIFWESQVCNQARENLHWCNCFHQIGPQGGFCLLSAMLFVCLCVCHVVCVSVCLPCCLCVCVFAQKKTSTSEGQNKLWSNVLVFILASDDKIFKKLPLRWYFLFFFLQLFLNNKISINWSKFTHKMTNFFWAVLANPVLLAEFQLSSLIFF